jgi:hypothetical protein
MAARAPCWSERSTCGTKEGQRHSVARRRTHSKAYQWLSVDRRRAGHLLRQTVQFEPVGRRALVI